MSVAARRASGGRRVTLGRPTRGKDCGTILGQSIVAPQSKPDVVHECIPPWWSRRGPDLQALLGSQLLAPWRADLPHWEVFIVRGVGRSAELPGDTALFFRLDHALGDGFALKNWLMGFTDEIKAGDLSLHWSSRTHPMPTSESTDHLPQLLAPRASPGASGTPVLSRIAAAGLVVWAVLKMLFFQVVLLLPALWIAVVESELDDTETILKSEAVRHRKSKGSSCLGRVLPCELARKEVRVSSAYSTTGLLAPGW